MTESPLLIERRDAVVINALSPELLTELCAAFRELQCDAEVRSVILTGNGRAFCAGMEMEKLVMTQANSAVGGDVIAQRRKGVQERGQSQL